MKYPTIDPRGDGPDMLSILSQTNYHLGRLLGGVKTSFILEEGMITVRDSLGLLTVTRHIKPDANADAVCDSARDAAEIFLRHWTRNRGDYAAQWAANGIPYPGVKTALHARQHQGRSATHVVLSDYPDNHPLATGCTLEQCEGGLCFQGVQGRPELCGNRGGGNADPR